MDLPHFLCLPSVRQGWPSFPQCVWRAQYSVKPSKPQRQLRLSRPRPQLLHSKLQFMSGTFLSVRFVALWCDMSPNRIRSHKLLFYMTNKTPSRVTSGLSLLHTDRSPRFSCRLTEIRCDIRLHCTLDYHIHILIFTLWMLKHIPRGDPVVSHL